MSFEYNTVFPLKSPNGALICEIEIQATINFDRQGDDYYLEQVMGWNLEKDGETAELPHYLVGPVTNWVEKQDWDNAMIFISEQEQTKS